jgi:hypothetical protein
MPKYVTIGYGDQAGYERTAPEVRAAAHAHDDENSAYMSSPLPIAGFAVIEAADLTEAVKLVSQSPCAVAHGVVEVWPLVG